MNSSLPFIGLLLGVLLIIKHLFVLLAPTACKKILLLFPRSRPWGTLLISLATLWSFFLVATTDLGEFTSLRTLILIAIAAGALLFWYFVPDFLAVRSLGFLLLLSGHALLEMAFLKSGALPILLSILAYVWIFAAFFLVGAPYLFRNAINILSQERHSLLWMLLALGGLSYGLLLFLIGGRILVFGI